MYHSGSPLFDVVGAVLSVIITVFWIGVWHLHLIGIMYGKWRLHRSSSFQIPTSRCRPVSSKSSSMTNRATNPSPTDSNVLCDNADAGQQLMISPPSTFIQVESIGDTSENIYTLFNGDLLPGVSILKPLVGIDQYLMHNLETFFVMSYPKFELLFCVPDESDPAIMVVQSLMKKYPATDARIFIGGENVGVNPKINNMMPGYRASKYDLVLVSDSGIMMRDDTLLDMVYTMLKPEFDRDLPEGNGRRLLNWLRNRGPTHGVGLVHQMPFCMDRDELGFPACLEKVYFGTVHARIYLSADCLRINCPTGMSALMRKNLLENKGGMGAFGQYLAEDYSFAKAVTDQGWIACISSQPAWQNSAVCHLAHFQGRLERWAKLRFAMVPLATVLEPFQECLLLGILASCAVSFLFDLSALGVFLVHVITWFLLDWTLLKIVQMDHLKFSKLDFIISWIFRETTCLVMFLKAIINPQIQWKSGYFRLKWGGQAEIVKSHDKELYQLPQSVVSESVPHVDQRYPQYLHSAVLSSEDVIKSSKMDEASEKSLKGSRSEVYNRTVDDLKYYEEQLFPVSKSSSRSRHVRSRSLPQKTSFFSVLNSFSSKLTRSGQIRSACDDLVTNNF